MLPASRRPRRLPSVISPIATIAISTRTRVERGDRGRDLLHGRRRRHGDGQHVVDEQRRGGDQRRDPAEVRLGHRVRPAAGRIGDADLAVAEGDDPEQDRDRDADLDREAERRAADAREQEREDDLLGRVGGRRDRVRAEDRERLLLRQALADLLLVGERPSEEDVLEPRVDAAHASSSGRWPRPSPSAGRGPCSGSRASGGARRGRACRPACARRWAGGRRSSA